MKKIQKKKKGKNPRFSYQLWKQSRSMQREERAREGPQRKVDDVMENAKGSIEI